MASNEKFETERNHSRNRKLENFKTRDDFEKYLNEDQGDKNTTSIPFKKKFLKGFRSFIKNADVVHDGENEIESVAQVRDPREDKDVEYDLDKNGKRKGLALIFSYPLLTKAKTEKEKDIDGTAMRFLLESIFGENDVLYCPNMSLTRVEQILGEDVLGDIADDYNSLTIAILSEAKPSNSSKIVVQKGEGTSRMEITVKKFLETIDEALWIDKPKLVIINAPRGEKDAASSKTEKQDHTSKSATPKSTLVARRNDDPEDFQWSLDRDWAFFWSTLEGNRINKASNSGPSPFIEILCDELNEAIEKNKRKDIYEIYLAVQREMLILESKNQQNYRNQVCEFRSTLRKKLILTDKGPEEKAAPAEDAVAQVKESASAEEAPATEKAAPVEEAAPGEKPASAEEAAAPAEETAAPFLH